MPYNPIIDKMAVSKWAAPAVADGTVGVLWDSGRVIQTFSPGQQPSFAQRRGSAVWYVVDTRPQLAAVIANLPDRSGKYTFPIQIDIEYKIERPEQIVELQLKSASPIDLDRLIERSLEPLLRQVSSMTAISGYETLPQQLQAINPQFVLAPLGVRMIAWKLALRKNDPQYLAFVAQIENILQPQSPTFLFNLDDRTRKHRFPIQVTLTYQINRSGLEQAIDKFDMYPKLIKSELENWLRGETYNYMVHEHKLLEQRLQNMHWPDLFRRLDLVLSRLTIRVQSEEPIFQEQLRHVHNLMVPGTQVLRYDVPDRSGLARFPVVVVIQYQITNPDMFLGRSNVDIEPQLNAILIPQLLQHYQRFEIGDYDHLRASLEIAIPLSTLHLEGIRFTHREILISLEDEKFQRHLRDFADLQASRPIRFTDNYPDQSGHYVFPIQVVGTYALETQVSGLHPPDTKIEEKIEESLKRILRRITPASNAPNRLEIIEESLKRILRQHCARFRFDNYQQLMASLAALIPHGQLDISGVRLLTFNAELLVNDPTFQSSVRELADLRAPRSFRFTAGYPDQSGRHVFPIQVTGTYAAESLAPGLNLSDTNTEKRIEDLLKPVLRQHCAGFRLDNYQQLINSLTALRPYDQLFIPGIQLLALDVELLVNDTNFQSQVRDWQQQTSIRSKSLRFSIPDASKRASACFPIEVTLEYQPLPRENLTEEPVADPAEFVRPRIDQILRQRCAGFILDNYQMVAQFLDQALPLELLNAPGVIFTGRHVVLLTGDGQFQAELERIRREEIETRTEGFDQFTLQVPTSEAYNVFEVDVSVAYQVLDRSQVPTETAQEAAIRLRSQIASQLQGIAAYYPLAQFNRAAQHMNEALANRVIVQYGLRTVQISVSLRPDSKAMELARRYADAHKQLEAEQLQDELRGAIEIKRRERELDWFQKWEKVYSPLIERGLPGLIILRLKEDPKAVKEIMQLLEDRDKQTFGQLDTVLKRLSEGGVVTEADQSSVVHFITNMIADRRNPVSPQRLLETWSPSEQPPAQDQEQTSTTVEHFQEVVETDIDNRQEDVKASKGTKDSPVDQDADKSRAVSDFLTPFGDNDPEEIESSYKEQQADYQQTEVGASRAAGAIDNSVAQDTDQLNSDPGSSSMANTDEPTETDESPDQK